MKHETNKRKQRRRKKQRRKKKKVKEDKVKENKEKAANLNLISADNAAGARGPRGGHRAQLKSKQDCKFSTFSLHYVFIISYKFFGEQIHPHIHRETHQARTS